MFAVAVAMSLSASAAPKTQPAKPYWLDPSVNRVGTEAPRASFFAFESKELAQQADKTKSQRYLSMEGQWRFKFVTNHQDAPVGFYAEKYDDASWEMFPVPGLFELNGHGDRIYKNVGYAWATQFANKPGFVEEKNNYTGSYRRSFLVPAEWKGQEIFIHVGSATSNLRLWVNGQEVGYSEDSKIEAEFNVTPYIRPGKENLIAMQVMRWCDGSYGEDQDFWRFTGIAREVYMNAEHGHAGMAGHDDLRDGGHAYGVTAQEAEVFVFCRRFVGRAGASHIHALLQGNPFFFGNGQGQLDEGRVVRAGHVRETGAELFYVGADEGIGQQVDVVLDNHEVSHMIVQVGAAGGIGDDEGLDAQFDHDADGEHHLVHVHITNVDIHMAQFWSLSRCGCEFQRITAFLFFGNRLRRDFLFERDYSTIQVITHLGLVVIRLVKRKETPFMAYRTPCLFQ